jgi:transcriptional repressor NrdR
VRCPACGQLSSKVVDSRPGPDGLEIRRRRECEDCSHRFTTYERTDGSAKMVMKRDGRHEPFDREKIRRSLRTACRKRPVSADAIERMVERAAARVEDSPDREVSSEVIGLHLLDELKQVDEVSFARFASVYQRFQSLNDFVELAGRMVGTGDDEVEA